MVPEPLSPLRSGRIPVVVWVVLLISIIHSHQHSQAFLHPSPASTSVCNYYRHHHHQLHVVRGMRASGGGGGGGGGGRKPHQQRGKAGGTSGGGDLSSFPSSSSAPSPDEVVQTLFRLSRQGPHSSATSTPPQHLYDLVEGLLPSLFPKNAPPASPRELIRALQALSRLPWKPPSPYQHPLWKALLTSWMEPYHPPPSLTSRDLINFFSALASVISTFPPSPPLPMDHPLHILLHSLMTEVEARLGTTQLNGQDISICLNSLSKIQGVYPPPPTFSPILFSHFPRSPDSLTPQGYATVLNAFVRLAMRPTDAFLDTLTASMMIPSLQQGGFSPRDLSMTLNSLARLFYRPNRAFLHAWVRAAVPLLPTFGPHEITTTLTALAKLTTPPLGSLLDGKSDEEDRLLLQRLIPGLLQAALPQLQRFSPQFLANCLSSLARLKVEPEPAVLDAMIVTMENLLNAGRPMIPLDISMTLHSLAKLQYTPTPRFLKAILGKAALPLLPRFQHSQLAALVSALAKLRVASDPELLKGLEDQARHLEKADPQSLATLLNSLASLPCYDTMTASTIVRTSATIMHIAQPMLPSFSEVSLVQVAKALERWRGRSPSLLQHPAAWPFTQALGKEALHRESRLDESGYICMVVAHLAFPDSTTMSSSSLPRLLNAVIARLPQINPDNLLPLFTILAEERQGVDQKAFHPLLDSLVQNDSLPEGRGRWAPCHISSLLQAMTRLDYNLGEDFVEHALILGVIRPLQAEEEVSNLYDLTGILLSLARLSQAYGHRLDFNKCLLPLIQLEHKALLWHQERAGGGGGEAVVSTVVLSLGELVEYQSGAAAVQSLVSHLMQGTKPGNVTVLPTSSHLASLFSGLAKLRYRPSKDWLAQASRRVEEDLVSFDQQDLALVVNAWARLRWPPPPSMWSAILDKWIPLHLPAIEEEGAIKSSLMFVASMLWSLSVLEALHPSSIPKRLVVSLGERAQSMIKQLGLSTTSPHPAFLYQTFLQLAQAAHFWSSSNPSSSPSPLPVTSTVQAIWSRYPRPPSPPSSRLQLSVADALKRLVSEENKGQWKLRMEVDDGLHVVDLALSPEGSLDGGPSIGVEVDGPTHFFTNEPWTRHPTGDSLFKRQSMLLSPQEWKAVVSVSFFEWNEAGAGGSENQADFLRTKVLALAQDISLPP